MIRGVAALALGTVLALCGCGDSSSSATSNPPTEAVKNALVVRLRQKQLSYRWIACVGDGRSFRGQPVVRCNVNFGEPHVEVYCAILRSGYLETNLDDRAFPCSHADAGVAPSTAAP